MPEDNKMYLIDSMPGIQRDGTQYASDYYKDGTWVRFQRGKPRKMGGYQRVIDNFSAPIRANLVWSRQTLNAIFSFSKYGIEQLLVDSNGSGSSIIDRTPASGYTPSDDIIWTVDTLYDDAAGSTKTLVLAHASNSMSQIDDATATAVYYGGADETAAFTAISGLTISGGLFATAPFAVYYGSDGNVTWSNINEPRTLDAGEAGSDRVTGSKVVKGLSVPSGSGPGGLLWSLDSVIQMDYVGGAAVFRFTTLNRKSSILAQNSVIEYDGAYYWVGVDRFMVFDGSVRELPNQMNINYFFDNLNYEQRQKVWAMKVPRFGEIWWFFPYGEATECNRAVIWNVREQTWYDVSLERGAGFYSQTFRYPIMASSELVDTFMFELTVSSGTFIIGDTIYGATSNSGTIKQMTGSGPYDITVQPDGASVWLNAEAVTSSSGGVGTVSSDPTTYQISSIYLHEKGTDAVEGEEVTAIESSFTTADISLTSGGPGAPANSPGIDQYTETTVLHPDFVLTGDLTCSVIGREYPQTASIAGNDYTISPTSGKIDMRDQYRLMNLKFTSNEAGGHYELGRTLLTIEPGDSRR